MKEKRKAWKENMSGYAPEKLVFLDESGINVNMTRFYARSKGGSRAVDAVPLWKPQNTTVLSSIQLSGETAYTTYSGGTTSERFVDYLRNILIPTLFLGIRNNLLDCYKAKAWMDLTDRKAAGEHVDSKNIKKHKNDVFRLTELIDPTAKVVAPQGVYVDIQEFVQRMKNENVDIKQLGLVGRTKEKILEELKAMYETL